MSALQQSTTDHVHGPSASTNIMQQKQNRKTCKISKFYLNDSDVNRRALTNWFRTLLKTDTYYKQNCIVKPKDIYHDYPSLANLKSVFESCICGVYGRRFFLSFPRVVIDIICTFIGDCNSWSTVDISSKIQIIDSKDSKISYAVLKLTQQDINQATPHNVNRWDPNYYLSLGRNETIMFDKWINLENNCNLKVYQYIFRVIFPNRWIYPQFSIGLITSNVTCDKNNNNDNNNNNSDFDVVENIQWQNTIGRNTKFASIAFISDGNKCFFYSHGKKIRKHSVETSKNNKHQGRNFNSIDWGYFIKGERALINNCDVPVDYFMIRFDFRKNFNRFSVICSAIDNVNKCWTCQMTKKFVSAVNQSKRVRVALTLHLREPGTFGLGLIKV